MKNFKRTTSFILVLAMLMTLLSMAAFAEGADPAVISVSLDETRTQITLRFDSDIKAATTTSLYSKIKLSKKGGTPSTISSSSKITIEDNYMYIKLSSSSYAITTENNYLVISKGTLEGQVNDIKTPVFDGTGPALLDKDSVLLNASDGTITLKFKTPIKGNPSDSVLKDGYVQIARSGSTYEPVPKDDISINSERGEIVIYLADWLSGKSARVKIIAGMLKNAENGNINLTDIISPYIDASKTSAPPEIDYVDVSSDKAMITVYFTDKIKNAFATSASSSLANTLLKSHILLSRGSMDKYEPLSGGDTLTVGSNYLKIVLANPLTSSRNYIKIDEDSLTDYYGNAFSESIVSGNITSGSSSGSSTLSYSSAYLSSASKIVIYFTTNVQRNPSITSADLRDKISISRNGGAYSVLSTGDSVSFSGSTMTISLRTPLSGSSNRVKVAANAVSSTTGRVLTSSFTTNSLNAGYSDRDDDYDSDYPHYSRITYDASAQRVCIYFDNDISFSNSSYLNNIYISRNGGSFTNLSSKDVVTISPSNAVTIILSEPLTGSNNRFKLASGMVTDNDTGYENTTVTTDYVNGGSSGGGSTQPSSGGTSTYSGGVTASLSDDLYTVSLKFKEAMYNNTDSLEALKGKIQISRNGAFSTLTADDYIRLAPETNELLIVLAKPADEYFSQIKILGGALCDSSNNTVSENISTLPLGEAGGAARVYLGDKAVRNALNFNVSGSAATGDVLNVLNPTSSAKDMLVKIPDDGVSSAKANISYDVLESIKRYGGKVALSFGDATYYMPASNVTLSAGDTLSISIANSPSTVSSKLSSAASADKFSIEDGAKTLTANVVSAMGSQTKVTHAAFAEKRFMLKNPSSGKTAFTLVRIENSGKVVPVPSKAEAKAGVTYITADTRIDGDYAAVSASHSFASTPAWVETPANTLGSRLILANASGSNLNASEAISRSETVMIMSKTLGILADSTGASPFFDMIKTDTFFDAVMSTVNFKLISGYPDSTFKPQNKLTRAEAMTIVARAMRFMNGKNVAASPDISASEANTILSKFSDSAAVDNWARVDIAECVQAGVVNGDNNGRLNPKANVTRAELIQLMYNILKNAKKL